MTWRPPHTIYTVTHYSSDDVTVTSVIRLTSLMRLVYTSSALITADDFLYDILMNKMLWEIVHTKPVS